MVVAEDMVVVDELVEVEEMFVVGEMVEVDELIEVDEMLVVDEIVVLDEIVVIEEIVMVEEIVVVETIVVMEAIVVVEEIVMVEAMVEAMVEERVDERVVVGQLMEEQADEMEVAEEIAVVRRERTVRIGEEEQRRRHIASYSQLCNDNVVRGDEGAGVAGRGLRANQQLTKWAFVCEYKGQRTHGEDAEKQKSDPQNTYLFFCKDFDYYLNIGRVMQPILCG